MGFFKSFAKSNKLRKLQMKYSPPNDSGTIDIRAMMDNERVRDEVIEEYLDLCEADEGIADLMKKYNVGRDDLKEISSRFGSVGLGWVRGHYIPLSTIAYGEPLYFYLENQRKQKNGEPHYSDYEVALYIKQYWDGKIRQGTLAPMTD